MKIENEFRNNCVMDILCLMGLFPKEYEKEIIKNSVSGVQNAANKLQWAIAEGFAQQECVNLNIINSLFIGSFPKRYKKINIPSFPFSINGNECGYNAGFLNVSLLKVFSRYYGAKKKIDEWAKNNENEKVVIAYAMTSPMVELLKYIKLKHPETKCVLVVPDLPEYMDMANKSKLYKYMKKKHITHLKKQLHYVDGYVFLTDYMKEWFDTDVKYTVVEGIYTESEQTKNEEISKEKVILYSGGLCEQYGVLDLVEAFRKLNAPDWKLELIGDGDLVPSLKKIAGVDERIVLRGLLPNSQVVKRQQQVSILVNPRKANQTFTKYSFPSKTIEYLASGTLMAGYKLPGIPDEYFEYIYEINPDDTGLEDCLDKLMNLSEQERTEIGIKGKRFIRNEKNAKEQCNKILKFIERLDN